MIKTVGTAHYVHKSNINELIQKKIPKELHCTFYRFLVDVGVSNYKYDVIKYDKGNVTLITSPDWDSANEPIVGICYRWKSGEWYLEDNTFNNNPAIRENFTQVYHNKWQFVDDTYDGFDIEQAKLRTQEWNRIPNIKQLKKKIGYKDYWYQLLQENGMEI